MFTSINILFLKLTFFIKLRFKNLFIHFKFRPSALRLRVLLRADTHCVTPLYNPSYDYD